MNKLVPPFKNVVKRIIERPQELIPAFLAMLSVSFVFRYEFFNGGDEMLFFAILFLGLTVWLAQQQNHEELLDTVAEQRERADSKEESS